MKKRKKISAALSKTKEALLLIAKQAGDLGEILVSLPYYSSAIQSGGIDYLRVVKARERDRALRNAFYTLRRNKFIRIQKVGQRLVVGLTEKGFAEIIRLSAKHAPHCRSGECILLMFDIPEQERRARALLRTFLRECGFTMMQRSVWRSERDVLHYLQHFIRKNRLEEWVTIFRGVEQ